MNFVLSFVFRLIATEQKEKGFRFSAAKIIILQTPRSPLTSFNLVNPKQMQTHASPPSFETCQGCLYACHGLDDVFFACGITYAETLSVAKGIASHCGHMADFEQIHGEIA